MIKFPILVYDLRKWSSQDSKEFMKKADDFLSEDEINNSHFRSMILIDHDQKEFFKDVNANLIIDSLYEDDATILVPFEKAYHDEFLIETLKEKQNVYWEIKREDFSSINKVLKRELSSFIKTTNSFNIIINLGEDIDYKELSTKNLTDFINIYQIIQTINPNILRDDIKIIFKLPSEINSIDQIKIITEMNNISGVVLSETMQKDIIK